MPEPSAGTTRRRHYVLYEPPLAYATACDRTVRDGMLVTTALKDVDCVRCRRLGEEWEAVRAPRVLAPSSEVPF